MVYYPYLRGKQFELLALREAAPTLASSNFTPIIEPVKESGKSLERSLSALSASNATAFLVINPEFGALATAENSNTLFEQNDTPSNIIQTIRLDKNISLDAAKALIEEIKDSPFAIIHSGFDSPDDIAQILNTLTVPITHIFIDGTVSKLYRRKFKGNDRVLLRDSFTRQKNASYPNVEYFSDLHIVFDEEGVNGFGDFLTVGDYYSESGGPAYAVAIHLTFIDPSKDDAMYVYHFVSDSNDSPTDPAGKFAQAVSKLVVLYKSGQSNLVHTSALKELIDLHNRGHFPGLGYIKKLSIKHHIETLADYFTKNNSV